MLRQYLSQLYSSAVAIVALAKPLVDALTRRRESWFNGTLGSAQEIHLNVVLAAIIVVLGLLAIFITPIFPILVLGAIAFILSFDRKAMARFVVMGGLSTGFGALTAVGVPSSSIMSLRLEGSPYATAFLTILDPYVIFVIAAIGIMSLGLTIELTPVQRDTLTTLIKLHRQESRAVKGKEIGDLMDRNPETIRIQMRSLKALNLVESATGPKGGYVATATAYDALNMDNKGAGNEAVVRVMRNGIIVEGASASEIVFNEAVHPSRQNCASIRIRGSIKEFNIGDEIEVGPAPVSELYLRGKIVATDSSMGRIFLDLSEVISIPRLPVKKVARRAVRINPNTSLREASRMLVINGAQEALVEDKSLGIVNMVDITKAVAEGRTDLEVREITTPGFLTINSDAPIIDAVRMLGKTGARQLVVSERGTLWGIITPRDLMEFLTYT